MRKYVGTISKEDVRDPMRPLAVVARRAIGPIQAIDAGKRVYEVDGTIQVENNEQRDAREEAARLSEFIERNKIRMVVYQIPKRRDRGYDAASWALRLGARHFRCVLEAGTRGEDYRSMVVYFSQGSGIKEDPTAADVLDCLASDSSGVQEGVSFEDWAAEYGYDTDSRKAERVYNVVKRQSDRFQTFIEDADEFDKLLYHTERL